MSKLGSLYIKLGEPEGDLCGCDCEVGDWAADEIQRLRKLLDEAADDIQDWGCYASEYMQNKHDLKGCVAKYRLTSNVK